MRAFIFFSIFLCTSVSAATGKQQAKRQGSPGYYLINIYKRLILTVSQYVDSSIVEHWSHRSNPDTKQAVTSHQEILLTELLPLGIPEIGPAPLPAFSVESGNYELRIDEETLKFAKGKLDEEDGKEKRDTSELVDRQNPPGGRVAFLVRSFHNLVREPQMVSIRRASLCTAISDEPLLIEFSVRRSYNYMVSLPPFPTHSTQIGAN